ncbi:MAG: hypothetical protein APR53_09475 [Methanoculleus sp. SDB]|nr:MAG: hypothetical protein APR53_09475 [Methanoculleus sp. SDB]
MPKAELDDWFDQGWIKYGTSTKNRTKIKKEKDIGSAFEDQVWSIFYRMGFPEMNKSSNFSIPRYDTGVKKQIDIFAREEQCICLVECKAAEKPHTKVSLGKDIHEIEAISHYIEQTIFAHFKNKGNKQRFKIIWILALKNIDLNQYDQERAKGAGITVIDDSMVEYYTLLSKHFGNSSKYQFLADMLPHREIPNLIEPVPAIKGKMGKTEFYSFVIEPEILLKIGYLSHRGKTNDDSINTYQRMANKTRLKKIAEYIQEKNGIFPTSIVINLENERGIIFEPAKRMAGKNAVLGLLHLPNRYRSAWIIDGQHRLYAYSDLDEAKTATLPVIAFINLKPDLQSKLFVDINGEQVKVSKNLLTDLYANLHWNSDKPNEQLLALNSVLIKKLDTDPKSPLRDRIKDVSGRNSRDKNITPTTIDDELKKSKLIGYTLNKKEKYISQGPLFKGDLESSCLHAKDVICDYYSLFLENEQVNKQWELGNSEGGYLRTNQGIKSTLKLLGLILYHLEHVDGIEVRHLNSQKLKPHIGKYIKPVVDYLADAPPHILLDYRRSTGESGVKNSTFALVTEINKVYPKFKPQGFAEYIERTDTSNNAQAYDISSTLEIETLQNVILTLKKEFGENIEQWWVNGVKRKIRQDAEGRAHADGDYSQAYEKYIYLIDLKEIISDNWNLFGDTYTINAKANDPKKKKLEWFNKVNEIRNIVAHPSKGGVNDEQLAYLQKILAELSEKLSNI